MADTASDIFAALAHPTRRQILQDLKDGELAAGEIAARFKASGPTISRHLSVLRQAGLVTERRDANRILYSLVSDRLALSVGDFLSTVCPEQIVLREVRKKKNGKRAGRAAADNVTKPVPRHPRRLASNHAHSHDDAPETIAAQALGWVDEPTQAITPPIHVSSTYLRDADNQYRSGRVYARADNPAFDQAEAVITALEGGHADAAVRRGHGGGDRGVPGAAAGRPRAGAEGHVLGAAQLAAELRDVSGGWRSSSST